MFRHPLLLEGVISVGKAAELAGEPRVDFEWQLVELGIPTVQYDLADYEQDRSSSSSRLSWTAASQRPSC